ncbi:MAG: AMP-binding protein [Methylocella sp.]
MQQTPGIRASDIFLAVTTPCFDIAALEIFLPLTTGAQLVIASRADIMDPLRLVGLIRRSATTMMQATPALSRGSRPSDVQYQCPLAGPSSQRCRYDKRDRPGAPEAGRAVPPQRNPDQCLEG